MSRSSLVLLLAPVAMATFTIPGGDGLYRVAAEAEDDGASACVTAADVVSVCANIPGFTDAPALEQEECLCCLSTTFLPDVYGNCADYLAVSATTYSSEYTRE